MYTKVLANCLQQHRRTTTTSLLENCLRNPTKLSYLWPSSSLAIQRRDLSTRINRDKNTIRIGCGSGFWGDSSFLPIPQLVHHGKLDFLVLDYLSEITMSLLVMQQQRNKELGWCPDFAQTVGPLLGQIKQQGIRVVTNAGGINPFSCMETMLAISKKAGVHLKIAVVTGDNLMDNFKDQITTKECPNPAGITSMNAYLGAGPIERALDLGADIVICGRCTDSALALGPLMHYFKWSWDDFDLLATGSLAGHLIECGAQATGGIFTDWDKVEGWENNGFPIAVCDRDGKFAITKPSKTGGLVSRATVAEQLLYEIHDPSAYVLPDCVCNFSQVEISEEVDGNVFVTGAQGRPPTPNYKVGGTYQDGWKIQSVCPVIGPRAREKSEKTAAAILKRCREIYKRMNIEDFQRVHIQVLGSEQAYGDNARKENLDTRDAVLWMAVQHQDRKALEIFSKEIASAGTGMAPGLTTIIGGRPKAAPVLKFFSFLHPKESLPITIKTSDDHEEIYQPSVPTTLSSSSWKSSSVTPEPFVNNKEFKSSGLKLKDIGVFVRSGDKGDTCNIGVIARDKSDYPLLCHLLTAEKVQNYFSHKFTSGYPPNCTRYEVPSIPGLNFVLEGSLDGGGIASLTPDPQGKGYAQMLLDIELN